MAWKKSRSGTERLIQKTSFFISPNRKKQVPSLFVSDLSV